MTQRNDLRLLTRLIIHDLVEVGVREELSTPVGIGCGPVDKTPGGHGMWPC